MLTQERLYGLIPALVTPTTEEGRVDAESFRGLVDYVLDNNSHGVLVMGGTGEYMGLRATERVRAVEACCEAVAGRAPVIAGVLTPCLPDAIDEARRFLSAGADALMLVEPYYNRLTQEGIKAHYREFVSATDAATLLYDIPYRTGVRMDPETIAELAAEDPRMIGMKMSNPDMTDFGRMMDMVGDKFSVLTGEEYLFVDHMLAGARGGILATNNLVPQAWRTIYDFLDSGRHGEARTAHRRLVPLIDKAFSSANPGPIKAALAGIGLNVGPLLPSLPKPEPDAVEQLTALARQWLR